MGQFQLLGLRTAIAALHGARQGFRTGHVYRQPLLRARNIAVSTVNQNDVAVPPAASSVGAVSIDCPLHMCNRAWLRSMKRTRTR